MATGCTETCDRLGIAGGRSISDIDLLRGIEQRAGEDIIAPPVWTRAVLAGVMES
jgi:hypothetical protein